MATAVKKTEENLPAARTRLDEMMEQHAGEGLSSRSADNLVPQISILQSNSPEVLEGPGQIAGAKAGDFLIGTSQLVDGKKGFWFQPCSVNHTWLEFKPLGSGGGFVAQHEFLGFTKDDIAIPPRGAKRKEKQKCMFDNGNEVVHYRHFAGIVWDNGHGIERVIPFKSTGHTTAKIWNTTAMQSNRLANGMSRALFAHVYHLTTEHRRNASGQWYALNVGKPVLLGPDAVEIVGDPEMAFGMGGSLCSAFERKEKQVAPETRVENEDVM